MELVETPYIELGIAPLQCDLWVLGITLSKTFVRIVLECLKCGLHSHMLTNTFIISYIHRRRASGALFWHVPNFSVARAQQYISSGFSIDVKKIYLTSYCLHSISMGFSNFIQLMIMILKSSLCYFPYL